MNECDSVNIMQNKLINEATSLLHRFKNTYESAGISIDLAITCDDVSSFLKDIKEVGVEKD